MHIENNRNYTAVLHILVPNLLLECFYRGSGTHLWAKLCLACFNTIKTEFFQSNNWHCQSSIEALEDEIGNEVWR